MHMSDLVERLGLVPSTISKTVTGMVKRGYVVRSDDPVDGRRVLVTLTEWGAKAYRAALAMLREDGFLREQLGRVLTTLDEPGYPALMTAAEHRANGLDLEHERLRMLARRFDYWADDLYEPGFDAMVRSPLQYMIDEIRRRRSEARRRAPKERRAIALWEYWGVPRSFRLGSSSSRARG